MSTMDLSQPNQAVKNCFRAKGLVAGFAILVVMAICSVFVGSRDISSADVWQSLRYFDATNSEHLLVVQLRVPRALLAIVVGAALGLAGAIMQAMTRNPLADPGLFGINAGATAAVVIAISVFGLSDVSSYLWFGLTGASVAGVCVLFLGGIKTGINPVRMVLAGAAITVVLLALTHIVTINSEDQVFERFRHWVVGSLQGRGYEVLLPSALCVALGAMLALLLASSLDTMALGNDVSRSLGINPLYIWGMSSLAVVLLSGAATAAAGPVSFVGLTAPHIARIFTGPDHRWLLPYSMLLSALLLLGADILGRVVGAPGEISVGIMVALIGGPFFIYLVRRWKIAQL